MVRVQPGSFGRREPSARIHAKRSYPLEACQANKERASAIVQLLLDLSYNRLVAGHIDVTYGADRGAHSPARFSKRFFMNRSLGLG
jgi:hypothetical protein